MKSIKDDLEKISDNLFLILEQMPGGVHVNRLKEMGQEIEAKLRQQGRIK